MSNKFKYAALGAAFALTVGAAPALAQDAPAAPEAMGGDLAYEGEISFWNRGEQALVETPRGQLKCDLAARREASTRRDHPGVMFRGQGNEPGWTVELAHDAPKLTLSTDYGENVETLPYMVSVMDNDAGRVVLENANADDFFRVRIEAGACFDGMSGHPFPARVTLTMDGEQYSGCGQGIAPSA